jgi:hypothetical protein
MKHLIFIVLFLVTSVRASSQSPPELMSPSPMQEMDNGCMDRSNGIEWDFEWRPIDGANKYQIWVKSDGAPIAAINGKTVKGTIYRHRAPKTYIGGRRPTNWSWRVRARLGSKWTEWSAEQKFTIEPLNRDCPVPIVGGGILFE